MTRHLKGFLLLVTVSLLVAGLTPALKAQVLYGSLVGNVVDSSESAVPNAQVSATNKGTGLVKSTTSDDRGFYSFRDLQEGTYDLSITAPGFATYTRTDIRVSINSLTRTDVQLQVGAVAETVNVSAAAAALQTDKSDVHVELASREVTDVPLTGYRNFQNLLNLVPGATPARYQNAVTDTPNRALTTNINGTSRNGNNTRIDGATSQNAWFTTHSIYIPPAEAIETVNVSTNAFDAEQGLAGGAAVNVTTKSGTNDIHGVAFDFLNNSAITARNAFFLEAKKPKNIQNQYGGTLGGPIKKDKMFFFMSYEALKQRTNFGTLVTVATARNRTGDFSDTGVTLFDPNTGNPDGTGRTAFTNATIPLNRQSTAAQKLNAPWSRCRTFPALRTIASFPPPGSSTGPTGMASSTGIPTRKHLSSASTVGCTRR
jgi:hypothetical protein